MIKQRAQDKIVNAKKADRTVCKSSGTFNPLGRQYNGD